MTAILSILRASLVVQRTHGPHATGRSCRTELALEYWTDAPLPHTPRPVSKHPGISLTASPLHTGRAPSHAQLQGRLPIYAVT